MAKPNKVSIFQLLSKLKSMNPEQRKILSSKKVSGQKTASQWLNDFDDLVTFDRMSDASRRGFWKMAILCILLSIFGGFLSFFFHFILVFLISIFLLGTTIWLFINALKFRKLDLPNTFRETLFPIITILKEETNPQQLIHLDINLGNKMTQNYLVETIPNTNKRYPKIKTNFFEVPYFNVETKLMDGSMIKINITDNIRRKDITKKSASRKIKYKTKYKTKVSYFVKIAFPQSRYSLGENDKKSSLDFSKVKTKSNEKYNIVQIKKPFVVKDPKYIPKLDITLNLIGQCFQHVNPK